MKALVLLSGGIDSTVCLAHAVKEYGAEEVTALTMYYGQKHEKELASAANVAKFLGVDHIVRDISEVFSFSDCSLLKDRGEIVKKSYAEQLADLGGEGTVQTYVPFRNGMLLSYATAIAVSLGAEVVFYGAHADDAAGRAYPDCTPEFKDSMADAVWFGTGKLVSLVTPLLFKNKTDVVAWGLELDAPLHLTWSCYEGKDVPCGICGTCIDRAKAFKDNNISDPILGGSNENS